MKDEKFNEFLSHKEAIKGKYKKPTEVKEVLFREKLLLTKEEARILGIIYYVALLMGHWDILNNINLSNSGSVTIDKKSVASIGGLGNRGPQCGFSGLNQDATTFKNPEISAWASKEESPIEQLKGFTGTVPFGTIVYPKLPRQLVPDLFNFSGNDDISKAMLEGFLEAHEEAKKNLKASTVKQTIDETLKKSIPAKDQEKFKNSLIKEVYIGDSKDSLGHILEGRLASLNGIIENIQHSHSKNIPLNMDEIARIQLAKIKKSQGKYKKTDSHNFFSDSSEDTKLQSSPSIKIHSRL